MDEGVQPCCVAARDEYIRRIVGAIVSYPLIREFPCPQCRRIVRVRLYEPPDEAGASA